MEYSYELCKFSMYRVMLLCGVQCYTFGPVCNIEMNEGEKEKKRKKDKKKEDKERKAREREARRKKREQVEKEAKEKERELRRKGIETKAFTPREEADIGELSDAGSVDSLDSQHDYLETHHVDNPMVRLALSATNEIEGGTCPALSLSFSLYSMHGRCSLPPPLLSKYDNVGQSTSYFITTAVLVVKYSGWLIGLSFLPHFC